MVNYNEPYIALPMRHSVVGSPPSVKYEWRMRGAWHGLAATAMDAGIVPDSRSHEACIAEHYWGYTRQRDGRTLEYRVEHPRWTVWPAQLTARPNFEGLYESSLARALVSPASVFIADGSTVTVFRGATLAAGSAAA